MKRSISLFTIKSVIALTLISLSLTSCMEKSDPVQYPYGHFTDSVVNLEGLNSAYDDYNTSGYQINGVLPLIFSTNKKSAGEQFDLEQGVINFTWDQQVGVFMLNSMLTTDLFYKALITKSETPLNDFGPYRTYSSLDGYEYLILASQNVDGNLDLKYLKNRPYYYGGTMPEIVGPNPITLLNTTFDDAYLTFDLNLDTAYYISNPEGNFDIYFKSRPEGKDIGEWFSQDYSASEKVDSVNSTSDDKCPMVYNKLMVFTSNRPGGYGGFDLYYSVFRNGKWSSPVNMGSKINTAYDEYRPLIGYFPDFKNIYMIFSSNRPGGKGGFDLYFTGINVPE